MLVLPNRVLSSAAGLSSGNSERNAAACSPAPGTPSTRCWTDSLGLCSIADLSDGETEQEWLTPSALPLKLPPVERAVAESGLCVRNTFLDFDKPQTPSDALRARSAPARPRRGEQSDSLDEDVALVSEGLQNFIFSRGLPPPPTPPAASLASLGPTWGAMLHGSGRCKPCLFALKGCRNGVACTYCHLCEPDKRKSNQAQRQKSNFSWRQMRKATAAKTAKAGRS